MISESRLERVEYQIRQEFPGLPDGAVFMALGTDPGVGDAGGMQFPIPEGLMLAILVPNAKWGKRDADGNLITPFQYRRVASWFDAAKFAAWERTRGRMVAAPDMVLGTYRDLAKQAVAIWQNSLELN